MTRPLISMCVALLLGGHMAIAKANEQAKRAQLVGWWEEYSPSSNLVHFQKNGSVKLMLKKGEIGSLRSLNGTWKILHNSTLRVVMTVGKKTIVRDSKLLFKDKEMIMIDKSGVPTKHRRHSGVLPKKFVW